MFEAIRDAGLHLKDNTDVRVIMMQGNGKHFCSGLDVKGMMGSSIFDAADLLNRAPGKLPNLAQEVSWIWRAIPVPVIAVIHGVCYGGGLQIALGADFRFADPAAKLSVMEAKWGMIPDMSGSVLLRELVSIDVAKELTMTARVVSGTEAKALGLVTHACEDYRERAQALAEEIIARSPDAVAATKQLFNNTWSAPEEDALKLETELQRKLLTPPLKNTMASASIGMDLPIKLSFKARQPHWRGSRMEETD